MRAGAIAMLLIGAALALPACKKNEADQNITITNTVPPNADIETLPTDESSETTDNQLVGGTDNADVTDVNAANNAY